MVINMALYAQFPVQNILKAPYDRAFRICQKSGYLLQCPYPEHLILYGTFFVHLSSYQDIFIILYSPCLLNNASKIYYTYYLSLPVL